MFIAVYAPLGKIAKKKVVYGVNHPVDNHYWWLVETLARIASIYLSVFISDGQYSINLTKSQWLFENKCEL